ncbi:MAG: hydrogenase maturation nickel metallochaperone HypA, partial [Eubacterium sp.]|nr:hydrogenase maturation nickel metallochaperone HypA [Eubacterium sp.]
IISKVKFEIDNALPLNSVESRIENFKNRIANKQIDVVEYVDSYSKVTLRCQVCGNTFSKSYNAMLKRSECPHCNPSVTPKAERKPKTSTLSAEEKQINRTQKYFEKIKDNSAGKVSVLAYNGAKEKLVAHCNDCGHEWSIRADHLLTRAYCPLCRKAK